MAGPLFFIKFEAEVYLLCCEKCETDKLDEFFRKLETHDTVSVWVELNFFSMWVWGFCKLYLSLLEPAKTELLQRGGDIELLCFT